MKRMCLIIAGILVLSTIAVGDVTAAGLGFYLEGGGGSGEITIEDNLGDYTQDMDVSHGGIGFMMDSAVSGSSVFNYRFHIGFESVTMDLDQSTTDIELDGLVMMHDFGFAMVRNRKVRLWAGPEVKLGFYSGESSDGYDDINEMTLFGFGPVFGVNIGLSSSVSLTFKLGLLVNGYVGEAENNFMGTYDINGSYNTAFLNAGMLF